MMNVTKWWQGLLFFVFFLETFGVSLSFATVFFKPENCPDQFRGVIVEIFDDHSSRHSLRIQKVVFRNQETLKGSVPETIIIDILKDGPFKIELDKEYLLSLRNQKLCWLQ